MIDSPREDTKFTLVEEEQEEETNPIARKRRTIQKNETQRTVVISPSSSVKYIPVMSPLALSNTSGFSNVKNAVPEVPSLLLVSFTSGTDVSTVSRTKEIVAALVTTNARRETEEEEEEGDLMLVVTNDCERKVEVVRDARADKVVDIVRDVLLGKFLDYFFVTSRSLDFSLLSFQHLKVVFSKSYVKVGKRKAIFLIRNHIRSSSIISTKQQQQQHIGRDDCPFYY